MPLLLVARPQLCGLMLLEPLLLPLQVLGPRWPGLLLWLRVLLPLPPPGLSTAGAAARLGPALT
jgi:hypothetical protein